MVQIKRHKLLNYISVLVCIFILCLGFIRSKNLALLAFCLNVVVFIFSPDDVILASFFAILPFSTIYKVNANSTSFFTVIEVVGISIIILRKILTKKKLNNVVGTVILYTIYICLISLLINKFSFLYPLKHCFGLLLIYFVLSVEPSKTPNFFRDMVLMYSIGIIIASIIALFREQIPQFNEYVRFVRTVDGVRFSGLNGDPNYYTNNIILCLSALLVLYEKKRLNFLFWPLLIILSLFGFLTFSKSFIVMLALLLVVVYVRLHANKSYIGIFLFAILMVLLVVFYNKGSINGLSVGLNRLFSAGDISELTTGRFPIWLNYLTELINHPGFFLFGHGVNASLLDGMGAHNTYIELLYYLGIVGSILLVFSVCYILNFFRKRCVNKEKKQYYPLVFLLLMYGFLGMLLYNEFFFQISLAFTAITFFDRKETANDI